MLSVVIPMYNEKAIIASTVRALADAMEAEAARSSAFSYEVILSDDGSTDASSAVAEEAIASLRLTKGSIRVLRAEQNAGKGGAVRKGVLAATGDIVLFTDSDLAYGTEAVLAMANKLTETPEAALMIGSRAIHPDGYAGYTFLRKLASKTFLWLLTTTAGFSCSDSQSGIKAFRREAAQAIFSRCTVNGWAFDFEALLIADRLGYQIAEFPVKIINHRESKVRLFSAAWQMMKDVRAIRRRVNTLDL